MLRKKSASNLEYKEIKILMYTNGVTQEKLAHDMDITVDTLNRKLNGTRDWKRSEMLKLCTILGIPVEKLITFFYPDNLRIS